MGTRNQGDRMKRKKEMSMKLRLAVAALLVIVAAGMMGAIPWGAK